jgi:glycosyltransferase involved in cell wall biosynthesis
VLHGKLEYYIKTRLPTDRVKLVRLPERSGLIRARLAGARAATADVMIFLDSHCEVVVQWCLFAICHFIGSLISVFQAGTFASAYQRVEDLCSDPHH